MDFCTVLTGKRRVDVVQFGRHFVLVVKAMGLNICDAGEYNSGQQSFGWRGGPILKHLR
jgi:hypothetical protein